MEKRTKLLAETTEKERLAQEKKAAEEEKAKLAAQTREAEAWKRIAEAQRELDHVERASQAKLVRSERLAKCSCEYTSHIPGRRLSHSAGGPGGVPRESQISEPPLLVLGPIGHMPGFQPIQCPAELRDARIQVSLQTGMLLLD